ncbi:MAG: hypothetical protein R6X31_09425 [Anaerolineae bacterium]
MAISASLDVARRLDRGRAKRRRGRSRRLRRLLGGREAIEMLQRRHGYFPKLFVWRHRRYDVCAVERCWTVSRPGLRGSVERYVFRVRARSRSDDSPIERTLEIYQDVSDNRWFVRRASR